MNTRSYQEGNWIYSFEPPIDTGQWGKNGENFPLGALLAVARYGSDIDYGTLWRHTERITDELNAQGEGPHLGFVTSFLGVEYEVSVEMSTQEYN